MYRRCICTQCMCNASTHTLAALMYHSLQDHDAPTLRPTVFAPSTSDVGAVRAQARLSRRLQDNDAPMLRPTVSNYSCWLCAGTAVEAFARLADSIFFHDPPSAVAAATPPRLYVNQMVSSVLTWREQVRACCMTDGAAGHAWARYENDEG